MASSERITKLDGLRGILSLIVALNHSFLVVAIPSFANVWGQNYLEFHDLQSKLQQLLMLAGNGGVAVTLFFLLSGLVLGQSLSRVQFSLRGLTSFIVKRLLRLYPVYVFVILLIALYMRLGFVYQSFLPASSWFNWWMRFDMTLKEFFYNLFFIHTYLGGVTWTLRVIVIASFIFPAFYLLFKKTSARLDLVVVSLLIFCSFTILNLPDFRDLRYLYMFYAGLSLPKFQTFFQSIPTKLVAWILFPTTFALFAVRYATDEYLGGVVELAIGWLIIGLIVYNSTKVFNFLNHKIILFFGKISYSLYLIHFSVLYILARGMFQYLPNLPYTQYYLAIHSALFLFSLPLATLLSLLVHRHIEGPSVTFANFISRKILSQ